MAGTMVSRFMRGVPCADLHVDEYVKRLFMSVDPNVPFPDGSALPSVCVTYVTRLNMVVATGDSTTFLMIDPSNTQYHSSVSATYSGSSVATWAAPVSSQFYSDNSSTPPNYFRVRTQFAQVNFPQPVMNRGGELLVGHIESATAFTSSAPSASSFPTTLFGSTNPSTTFNLAAVNGSVFIPITMSRIDELVDLTMSGNQPADYPKVFLQLANVPTSTSSQTVASVDVVTTYQCVYGFTSSTSAISRAAAQDSLCCLRPDVLGALSAVYGKVRQSSRCAVAAQTLDEARSKILSMCAS